MPFKDPAQRHERGLKYSKEYAQRRVASKPPGVCHVAHCQEPQEGGFTRCSAHRAYARVFKKQHRAQPRKEGRCSVPDCPRQARAGGKLCAQCLSAACAKGRTPKVRVCVAKRNLLIKREVMAAYGGHCACCAEARLEFLTIDHIDGWDSTGPRGGNALRRWLRRNNYPEGFRVLRLNCNFALGHHGYCPHGSMTQVCRAGRPRLYRDPPTANQRRQRRAMNQRYKLEALTAYGGAHLPLLR